MLLYIEIILQIVCRIWILCLTLYWAGNNIIDQVDLIQSRINLQYIRTPSLLQSNWIMTTYGREKNRYVTDKNKNEQIYDLTPGSENMLSYLVWDAKLIFLSDCRDLRYLRYSYLKNWGKGPSVMSLFRQLRA